MGKKRSRKRRGSRKSGREERPRSAQKIKLNAAEPVQGAVPGRRFSPRAIAVAIAVPLLLVAGWFAVRSLQSNSGGGHRLNHSGDVVQFRDVTRSCGIEFSHTRGSREKDYIVETKGGGVALFDYDGDGRVDIFFTNGSNIEDLKRGSGPSPALYRNEGGWRFREVTESAGLARPGWSRFPGPVGSSPAPRRGGRAARARGRGRARPARCRVPSTRRTPAAPPPLRPA